MNRRRRNEILTWSLVAATVVAGVWVFVDRGTPTTGEQSARAGMLLRVWRQDDVTRVTIVRASERTEIVREGDGWKLTAPRPAPADLIAVNSLLNAIGGARAERSVGTASEADRATFGLTKPRATVEIAMKGVTLNLTLGATETAQSDGGAPNSYLEVAPYGDEKGGVFVVAPEVARAIDRGAEAYRDPSLLAGRVSFSYAKIDVRTHDGGGVALARADHATWRVTSGAPFVPVRADVDAVDGLLAAFAGLKADPFVPDATPVDVAQGGTIDLALVGGGTVSVAFGGACPANEKAVVVQLRVPETSTGCVPRIVVDRLAWPPSQYVDTHVFGLKFGALSMKTSEIEAVKIEQGGKLLLDAERRGEGLHLRAPDDEQAQKDATDRWLAKIAAMHGELIATPNDESLAKLGLSPPASVVTLRRRVDPLTLGSSDAGPDEWEQVVEVGATTKDETVEPARAIVHVRRRDDGAILRLDAADVGPIASTAILELRAPNLLDVSYETIVRMATTTTIPETIGWEVERATTTGAWSLVSPKSLGADAGAVSERAKTIAGLTCARWAADRDDGSFGLSAPRATISLRRQLPNGADAAAPTDLSVDFGAPAPDGVYARAKGRDAICVVAEGTMFALLSPPFDRTAVSFDPTDAPTIVATKGNVKRGVTFDAESKLWHDAPDAGAPMGDVAARAFADAIRSLRAETIVHLGTPTADEGLATPTLVLESFDASGKRNKRVTVGSLGKMGSTVIYFARVDGIDATYGVLRADVDKLLAAM